MRKEGKEGSVTKIRMRREEEKKRDSDREEGGSGRTLEGDRLTAGVQSGQGHRLDRLLMPNMRLPNKKHCTELIVVKNKHIERQKDMDMSDVVYSVSSCLYIF